MAGYFEHIERDYCGQQPSVYLLEGGFSKFYRDFQELTTGGYVSEKDDSVQSERFSNGGKYDMNIPVCEWFADGK